MSECGLLCVFKHEYVKRFSFTVELISELHVFETLHQRFEFPNVLNRPHLALLANLELFLVFPEWWMEDR